MAEQSSELVDLAWNAANAANAAFDKLRAAQLDLEKLRSVGRLGLSGVTIAEEAYGVLEHRADSAQTEFDALTNMAAPVMFMPDSPFASTEPLAEKPEQVDETWTAPQRILLSGEGVESLARREYEMLLHELGAKGITAARIGSVEQKGADNEAAIFNYGAPVRTAQEMVDFAEMQGYNTNITTRIFNILTRKVGPEATIEVPDLANYDVASTERPSTGIVIVRLPGNQPYSSNEQWGFDIDSLYRTVKAWLAKDPKIRNLGKNSISFLADYINHALPEIEEPLRVDARPIPKGHTEVLEPRELLDTVATQEGEKRLVTHLTLRRFALSKGFNAQQTSSFPAMFDSLALTIDPGIGYPHFRNSESSDLFNAGSYQNSGSSISMHVWGIKPERFIALIEEAEQSPAARKRLDAYTDFSRPLVGDYIAALKELLAGQD